MTHKYALYVDLDGTLVRTDLFLISTLKVIRANPLNILRMIFWMTKGRSYLKYRIAQLIDIDARTLPYNDSLVAYLREQRNSGRKIVLATAAPQKFAAAVAEHLQLFDDVISSEANVNLKGRRKLEGIKEHAVGGEFSYAGDSSADGPIWAEAASGIYVDAPKKEVNIGKITMKVEKVFSSNTSQYSAFIKQMRIHQWAKNMLVFVPLLTSHSYLDPGAIAVAVGAFLSFSLCASGVYFLNDLLDLEADRSHSTKRNRPLASGDLSVKTGIVGAIIFPIAAFTVAFSFLSLPFVLVLGFYFLATNGYSFFLKSITTADVMTLAILYTLRVIAGSAAISVDLSFWLMVFSVFIFVSLAYMKRYIETASLAFDQDSVKGRGYYGSDSEAMFSLGVASMSTAALVLAFYVNSDDVRNAYQSPDFLWFLCLLLLYWGNRIWLGARRGKINEDPLVFAIKDNISRLTGIGFLLTVLAAKYIDI